MNRRIYGMLAKRLDEAIIRAAHRRKALSPNALPFGVASLDGKHFSIPSSDDWYAQRHTRGLSRLTFACRKTGADAPNIIRHSRPRHRARRAATRSRRPLPLTRCRCTLPLSLPPPLPRPGRPGAGRREPIEGETRPAVLANARIL